MKLDDLRRFILCANLSFGDKLHVLRTIVDVSAFPDAERARFSKRLCELAEYSKFRNMIAHESFGPDDTENDPAKQGVTFSVVKAKGKFSLPPVIWDQEKFRSEYKLVEEYAEDLVSLRDRLRGASFDHSRVTRLITILAFEPNSAILRIE